MPSSNPPFPDPWENNLSGQADSPNNEPDVNLEELSSDEASDDFGISELQELLAETDTQTPISQSENIFAELEELLPEEDIPETDFESLLLSLQSEQAAQQQAVQQQDSLQLPVEEIELIPVSPDAPLNAMSLEPVEDAIAVSQEDAVISDEVEVPEVISPIEMETEGSTEVDVPVPLVEFDPSRPEMEAQIPDVSAETSDLGETPEWAVNPFESSPFSPQSEVVSEGSEGLSEETLGSQSAEVLAEDGLPELAEDMGDRLPDEVMEDVSDLLGADISPEATLGAVEPEGEEMSSFPSAVNPFAAPDDVSIEEEGITSSVRNELDADTDSIADPAIADEGLDQDLSAEPIVSEIAGSEVVPATEEESPAGDFEAQIPMMSEMASTIETNVDANVGEINESIRSGTDFDTDGNVDLEASPLLEDQVELPDAFEADESIEPEQDAPQTPMIPVMPTSSIPADLEDHVGETVVSTAQSTSSVTSAATSTAVPTYKRYLGSRKQIAAFAIILAGMTGLVGYGLSKAGSDSPLQVDFKEPGFGLFGDRNKDKEEDAAPSSSDSLSPTDPAQGRAEPQSQGTGESVASDRAGQNNPNTIPGAPKGGGELVSKTAQDSKSASSKADKTTASKSPTPPPIDISDVPPDHWAHPYVVAMYEQGIVPDFPDGKFQPDKPVTRAELAASLQRAFKDQAGTEPIPFKDISQDFWAKDAITYAVNQGFMKGYSQEIFEPDQQIPRYQVLVSLVSGLGLTKLEDQEAKAALAGFPDLQEMPTWALGQVAASQKANLIIKEPDNTQSLDPTRPATRAEVNAMIYKALVKTGKIKDTVKSSP